MASPFLYRLRQDFSIYQRLIERPFRTLAFVFVLCPSRDTRNIYTSNMDYQRHSIVTLSQNFDRYRVRQIQLQNYYRIDELAIDLLTLLPAKLYQA